LAQNNQQNFCVTMVFRFIVNDVVAALDTVPRSVSFDVLGDPLVQQRPRIAYRGRSRPIYYDPSAIEKRHYTAAIRAELMSTGITQFPVFPGDVMSSAGVSITLSFFLPRFQADYRRYRGNYVLREVHHRYPSSKDTDNMVKFVMDCLHDVFYANDNCVVSIIARGSLRCIHDNNATRIVGLHGTSQRAVVLVLST
jgi:Holliday junction resolvase RusA-like endonuclease